MDSETFFRKFHAKKKKLFLSESKMRLAYEKYQFLMKEYSYELKEYNQLERLRQSVEEYEKENVKKFF